MQETGANKNAIKQSLDGIAIGVNRVEETVKILHEVLSPILPKKGTFPIPQIAETKEDDDLLSPLAQELKSLNLRLAKALLDFERLANLIQL